MEYIRLTALSLLPVVATIVFYLLNTKTNFKNYPYKKKQTIIGVCFGLLAIIATEFGVPINGAQMNVRDASVLAAGLLFGGEAGIIAGLMGGIERYIAVAWGVGSYTRIACSVSTIIAGFYSASLRKYMLEDKKPSTLLSLAIGTVMEITHMLMVVLTNLNDPEQAMRVVQICTVVMVPFNSITTMAATFFANKIDDFEDKEDDAPSINSKIQNSILIALVIAITMSTAFTYQLQSTISENDAKTALELSIEDIILDVDQASDRYLLEKTRDLTEEYDGTNIMELQEKYDIYEISYINSSGIISDSTNLDYFGFDMRTGEQSKEFLKILDGDIDELSQSYGPISYDDSISMKYAAVKYKDGFIQTGYNAEQFQSSIVEDVKLAAKNRHVGTTGYMIIANANRDIVSSPDNHSYTTLDKYGISEHEEEGAMFDAVIDGEKCKCLYAETEGYYVISIYPEEELYHVRDVIVYVNVFIQTEIFALIYALIYYLIKKLVVSKINNINVDLNKISSGDLDVVVDEEGSREFISLSKDINSTVASLKGYIDEAARKNAEDLERAKTIQESALPHEFPDDSRFEIYAMMDAAKEVGGDFYDVINTYSTNLHFLIADVSGKGIPGALFMMRAKSELHALTETGMEVSDIFTMGNERLCQGNEAEMFVTAWQGNIDLKTGLVKFANAGHNPPVLIHNDGRCEYIKGKPGFVLAGMDGVKYKPQELQLEKGDILFLYTDGVTEATNANNQLFGEDRLIAALSNLPKDVTMDYLICEVFGAIGRFVEEAEQFDDITMLALKYNGEQD